MTMTHEERMKHFDATIQYLKSSTKSPRRLPNAVLITAASLALWGLIFWAAITLAGTLA